MSCDEEWNLLSCGSQNLYNNTYDLSRAVWQNDSTCWCHDAIGVKCIAWCTKNMIPQVEHTVITLNKDTDEGDIESYFCSNELGTLIGCYFKGNTNSSIERKQSPEVNIYNDYRFCLVGGLKNDQFVITCLAESNYATIQIGLTQYFQGNTSKYLNCPRDSGFILNCKNQGTLNSPNFAIVTNETTCECYIITYSSICEAICFRPTILY